MSFCVRFCLTSPNQLTHSPQDLQVQIHGRRNHVIVGQEEQRQGESEREHALVERTEREGNEDPWKVESSKSVEPEEEHCRLSEDWKKELEA